MDGDGVHGRKRPKTEHNLKQEDVEEDALASINRKPSLALDPSDLQLARTRLRQRWELACVLNFLRVFRSLTLAQSKLELSPEQIENALINPNTDLSDLHIAILKGIPPVSKHLSDPDAWITILCKKLDPWWPWVAEGDIPLNAAHGEEISIYKELDPITRLLLLKSLCEIRALQDDVVSYINDALKQGNEICTFRKDRMAGDGTRVAFWYDGDAVMGYRLYMEVSKVEFTPRKGKGCLTPPPTSQWETLATNLEEFQQISEKLSSSEIVDEAAVAKVITNEVIPVLEGIQKKKEKVLKRQQKQVMLLNGPFNTYQLEGTRSRRSRKPVNYTSDEYDKTIDEAIQLNMKKKAQEPKHDLKGIKYENGQVNSNGDSSKHGEIESQTNDGYDDCKDDNGVEDEGNDTTGNDKKLRADVGGVNKDYEDESNETENDHTVKGNRRGHKENNISGLGTRRTRHFEGIYHLPRDVARLRSSMRTCNAGNLEIKTIGQKEHVIHTIDSDSGTGTSDRDSECSSDETSGAGKEPLGVEEGSLQESDGDV